MSWVSSLTYGLIILFVLVSLPRGDDAGYVGMVGNAVDEIIDRTLGGRSVAKCPFLRKGMLVHSFSNEEYPVSVQVGDSTSESIRTVGSVMIEAGGVTCPIDSFVNFAPGAESILKCETRDCDGVNSACAECGGSTVCLYCDESGPCECYNDETGEYEHCNLERFVTETFFAPGAEKERALFSLMGTNMPAWTCFLFFGVLPFTLAFYITQAFLSFTPLRGSTKSVVAGAMAIISVFSGSLVGLTVALVRITLFTTNWGTLIMFFSVAFLVSSIILLTQSHTAVYNTYSTASKLRSGIRFMKAIGRTVSQEQARDRT